MTTLEEIKAGLEEIHTDVIEVKTVLKGYDHSPGLCQKHEELAKDYYKFKRLVIGITCGLVGTGLTGVGIVELIKRFISE